MFHLFPPRRDTSVLIGKICALFCSDILHITKSILPIKARSIKNITTYVQWIKSLIQFHTPKTRLAAHRLRLPSLPRQRRGAPGAPGERQTFPESLYSGAMTIAAANYPVHQQYPGGIPRFSPETRVSAASPTRTFLKASSFGLVLSSSAVGTAAPSARRKTIHHLNSALVGGYPKKTNIV